MAIQDVDNIDQTIGLIFIISTIKHLRKIQWDLSKSMEEANIAINGLAFELDREKKRIEHRETIRQLSKTHSAPK